MRVKSPGLSSYGAAWKGLQTVFVAPAPRNSGKIWAASDAPLAGDGLGRRSWRWGVHCGGTVLRLAPTIAAPACRSSLSCLRCSYCQGLERCTKY